MTDSGALFSPITLRNLSDKSYEKRKLAAIEIETMIKGINAKGLNKEATSAIIHQLVNDFTYSSQPNHRKGGLIGLAACAISLAEGAHLFLPVLLPPVLKCIQDQESRVRYYACEALYNIAKVTRTHVLSLFNEIFDALCKLYADLDVDVKSGAQLLDRLIKDVVTESSNFDSDRFIPLLKERIKIRNVHVRQLVVSWITVLDSVPELDMLEYLPEYLGGIFEMLSDAAKDIRQQASALLQQLLTEIVRSGDDADLQPMVPILVQFSANKDALTRLTALQWLIDFIALGKTKLLPFYADILGSSLSGISDSDATIRQAAERANDNLLQLVQGTVEDLPLDAILTRVTAQLANKVVAARLASLQWIAMLLTKMPGRLFSHLNEIFPALLKTLQDPDDRVVILDLRVLALISLDEDNQLIRENFEMVLRNIVDLFASDRSFLEGRGSVIVRELSTLLQGESIYRALAVILQDPAIEPEFASLMAQTLNVILLTSSELFDFRRRLKFSLSSPESRELFVTMFSAWTHNAVASFSLCLLAQAYELASALVFRIADVDITLGFLMQIDKLVQLIESPIFIHLRLQLLEPRRHPFLLKSLYGLLMLLPQSPAFSLLKARLDSVSHLGLLNCIPHSEFATSACITGFGGRMSTPLNRLASPSITSRAGAPPATPQQPSNLIRSSIGSVGSRSEALSELDEIGERETQQLDFAMLLHTFQATQAKHSSRRKQMLLDSCLLKGAGYAGGAASQPHSPSATSRASVELISAGPAPQQPLLATAAEHAIRRKMTLDGPSAAASSPPQGTSPPGSSEQSPAKGSPTT